MTSETIRDVVQIHLPGWFIESAPRLWLVTSTFFNDVAGDQLGFKLRYAVHKSTLDVSTKPYDVSTFSDVFMVMREFPAEFQDVLDAPTTDPLRSNLRSAFEVLRDTALVSPYEKPYSRAPYPEAYYSANRTNLKRFARSCLLPDSSNFTFSTRIQALLTRYQTQLYERTLDANRWAQLPDWQRLVLLAMIRDL